jgi:hypothetical protein
MKLAALLFAVAVLAGCGGGGKAPHAISVAEVKQAFAHAGLPLRAEPPVPLSAVGDVKAFRRAAEQTEATLTWGGPGTEVTVFRSARYAAQVAKQISSQIPNNVRLKRISNALFTWVVPETPALRAAIRHLS